MNNSTRPKRLLSLDGGGIRGIIPLKFLLEIEKIICQPNTPWNCLGDYFDMISGTSTGAIIAAGLAKGMRVQEILDIYTKDGSNLFTQNSIFQRFWSKYNPQPLEEKLKEIFGDLCFGSEEFQKRAYLMIVAKNVTKGKPWFFVNHPNNVFFNNGIKDVPIWHIVRASSAAPTFFPPHSFKIGNVPEYEFIDGAMTMFNNPSYQLFLEATTPEYNIGWEQGKDNLLLISLGTGFSYQSIKEGKAKQYNLINWASYAAGTLMNDANAQQNLLMKKIGYNPRSEAMNSELKCQSLPTKNISNDQDILLTYHRHTILLSKERLQELGLEHIDPELISPIDCIDQIDALCEIGEKAAEQQIKEENFANFLHPDS